MNYTCTKLLFLKVTSRIVIKISVFFLLRSQVVLKKYSVLHSKLAYPINEVICLMKLRHLPCVIKLLDYYIDKQTLEFVLVLEYPYPCYTVYDYLKENLPGEVTCKYILSRIANALLVCSASGYACGDVNLENALVCVTGDHVATIKLIDFETCTDLANGNYSLTGCVYTPAYRSPEQNQYPCDYDKEKAQVYAMGCMIQEMMNMKLIPLYSRVRLLVASMKTKNPELRLSLARFVSHAFFNV